MPVGGSGGVCAALSGTSMGRETMSLLAQIRQTVQFYRRLKHAEKVQPACVDCTAYFLRSGATVSQADLDAYHAAKHEEPPASQDG